MRLHKLDWFWHRPHRCVYNFKVMNKKILSYSWLYISSRGLLILFTLISSTCSNYTFGQSIKGKVLEINGKPLPFVNVLLLSAKDSSLVKGAVSDTLGSYAIDNIRNGTYLISASMIGFKQRNMLPVTISAANEIAVEPIKLEEDVNQLKEVVVVEKRPFVEQHLDRMVVNVANSIIASGSTALEVLEKAPGVTVDRQNDQIQLRGKDGVIVQVDGKQTYLSMNDLVALLRSMPSDNIDQIELITNPSAKYDAAGNSGIINIQLKKNNAIGTNGSITLGGGSGRYHREGGSLQLNHRAKQLNFFVNYSANSGGNYFDLATRQIRAEQGYTTFADQDTYIRFRTRGQTAKAGVDYFLSKSTTIGVIWTGFWNNHQEEGSAESAFRREESGALFLHAKTDKTISSIASNQIGNINFQHTFKNKGGQLNLDFDKGRFDRDFLNTLHTHTLIFENDEYPFTGLINEMPTEIKITTIKIDYNRSLFERAKIEMGFKYSSVWNDNDLTISQGEEGNLQVDEALSNHFLYKEQVNAGYVSVTGKLGEKTDIQLGLRAEHTHSVGNSISLNNIVTRDYLNLFPSLFLSRPILPNQTLGLSYSYRIDRPNYQNLNPARSYVDPYLYSQGNAYLTPQYTHSLELKHGFKDQIFTSIGASFVDDFDLSGYSTC